MLAPIRSYTLSDIIAPPEKGKWANVIPHFRQFLDNLEPTPTQHLDINTKVQGIANCLCKAYYPNSLSSVNELHLVVGSFGKRCAVRPVGDVDILFQLPNKDYDRFKSYSFNGQSAMLQEVKNILSLTYSETDIRGDGQVVVVPFSTVKIEVVPIFYINKIVIVPNTHNGGYWNTCDPFAEINDLNSADSVSSGKARDLIRMLKSWKASCNVPIKSIVLEKVAASFSSSWEYKNQSLFWYDWMIRDFFLYLSRSVNVDFKLPGSLDVLNTGDEWVSRCVTAYQRALKACEYECDFPNNSYLASIEWKKIFGDNFQHLR